MKILCVIDSLGSGGAQRQLVNLALAFQERGHKVDFLVYHCDPFYYQVLSEYRIKIIEVLEDNYIKRILKMRHIIRKGNYDSVLSFLEAASFICTVAGFPYRKWTLVVGERSANPNIFKSIKLKLYRWFHIFVSAVVANSHENIKLVKKINPILNDKKLHVIYNLIDFDKWQFNSEGYVYRKNGKFNLTVVASHQYLKNLNGLVEAVNLLSDEQKKNLTIHWYGGDRPDRSKLEAIEKISKYKLNEIFNFHEPTLEIASKVNQADAVGLFSFYEGLPNVICEAMVNAKVVIASDISDVSLLIEQEFIFDPNDPKHIAEKIRHLLSLDENSLREIGQKNQSSAFKLFDKESILQNYISIMSRLS